MQIKRKRIEFHNVISIKSILEDEDWFFLAEDLRKYIVEGGLYQTGPIFYQIKDVEDGSKKEYTIFMPINALVNVKKESNENRRVIGFKECNISGKDIRKELESQLGTGQIVDFDKIFRKH